jgi:hypothetical protein
MSMGCAGKEWVPKEWVMGDGESQKAGRIESRSADDVSMPD